MFDAAREVLRGDDKSGAHAVREAERLVTAAPALEGKLDEESDVSFGLFVHNADSIACCRTIARKISC